MWALNCSCAGILPKKPKHSGDTRVGEKHQDFRPNQRVPRQVENVITSLNSQNEGALIKDISRQVRMEVTAQ